MTDNEIVKALECCILSDCSRNCPLYYTTLSYHQCREATRKNALNLINRLQAENERLKKGWKADVILTANAKAEAYKEFAERLKEKITEEYNYFEEQEYPRARISDIDNLLKELVGEGGGNK